MLFAVSVLVAIFTTLWLIIRFPKHAIDQLPGPPRVPFLGNLLIFLQPRQDIFAKFNEMAVEYRTIFRTWQTKFIPIIHPLDPKYVETILTSNTHINKSSDYDFLKEWLGTGLLISTGSKWHSRRKLLTPAFHFKILEEFTQVFNEKTHVLVEILRENIGKEIDITPLITRNALDVICETSMGQPINAQKDINSPYVTAVYEIGEIIVYRILRPWLHPNFIFKMTAAGKRYQECLKILHDFTKKVIQDRKAERRKLKLEKEKLGNKRTEDDIDVGGGKRKTAFLDILLAASEQDGGLTDEDIREEVDTFMFEGHDTTATTLNWTLFYLSAHPEIQEKCMVELNKIFDGDNRYPNWNDFSSMKYLERVVKEVLRLRPPVATIARRLKSELKLEDFNPFPKETNIRINIYNVHRNPEYFPDPEKFDPDRFLPENCVGRHPYVYIPFSAGPRNCIGQKFAMLEMKSVLSTILRNFRFESVNPDLYSEAIPDLILRPMHGLVTRFYPRRANGLVTRMPGL